MSETLNIAALASTVSTKVLSAFGWGMREIQDENFFCLKQEKHQTKSNGGTHPVDCVFFYQDPFSNKTIFFLCDLKSYAKASITSCDFAPYIRGVSKAIDCAAVSEQFKNRYIPPEIQDFAIEGLLFVYNHDQEYDKDFKSKGRGLAPGSLPHSPSVRVHLLGPDDIAYLQAIVVNMKAHCAEHDLEYRDRQFFYPQQLIHTPGKSLMAVATMEMLRGKLIIAEFKKRPSNTSYYSVYLRDEGSIEDFEYIITYLYRNGIMNLAESVEVKGPYFKSESPVNFEAAKTRFLERHYRMREIDESLRRIDFGRVDIVTNSFCSIDHAMHRKK